MANDSAVSTLTQSYSLSSPLSSIIPSTEISSVLPSTQKVPSGLGAIPDSLSTAAKSSFPNLFVQPKTPILPYIKLYNNGFEKNCSKDLSLLEGQISQTNEEHADLSEEAAKLTDQQTQQTKHLSVWKAVGDVTSYGVSAASIVVGIGFCASPVGAAALVTAGTVGIGSKLMNDVNGWRWVVSKFTSDQNTQQQYTSYLETAATVASIGTSLIGGFFMSTVALAGNFITTAITVTAATVSTAASVGSNFTQASTFWTEAAFAKIGQQKTVLFNDLSFAYRHIQSIGDIKRIIFQALRNMIRYNFTVYN